MELASKKDELDIPYETTSRFSEVATGQNHIFIRRTRVISSSTTSKKSAGVCEPRMIDEDLGTARGGEFKISFGAEFWSTFNQAEGVPGWPFFGW